MRNPGDLCRPKGYQCEAVRLFVGAQSLDCVPAALTQRLIPRPNLTIPDHYGSSNATIAVVDHVVLDTVPPRPA